jgi:hypothetical protein
MKKIVCCLGALGMLALTPFARADYEISVAGINCVGPTVDASPSVTAACPSTVTTGTVTITDLSETGNQTGTFTNQLGTTLEITNSSSTAVTFTIYLADSNFSSPTAPPGGVLDASGATINSTIGTNSFTLTSCVDQSNQLVPPSTATFCKTPATGEAAGNATLNISGPGTTSDESNGSISTLSAPFALDQKLVITAGADSSFNVTTSQVLTPVPEPMSITLLGGVLLLTCRAIKRKRNQDSTTV